MPELEAEPAVPPEPAVEPDAEPDPPDEGAGVVPPGAGVGVLDVPGAGV